MATARQKDESYKDYRKRLRREKEDQKRRESGRMIHQSTFIDFRTGTKIRPGQTYTV